MTKETEEKIIDLIRTKSQSEVAAIIGCGTTTVSRVLIRHNIKRTNLDKAAIRSRIRSDQVRSERRRAIFGLDQKSNLKVFSNKERNKLKTCLRRKGYVFPDRGVNVAYISETTLRDYEYEERGRKLGIIFRVHGQEKVTV